jgi:hypothetical protein
MCKSTKDKNKAAPGPDEAVDESATPPSAVITIRSSVTRRKTFKNPLNDPALATTLLQVNPGGAPEAAAFDEEREYTIFVPKKLATDFFNAPAGSKPNAKVSIFLGVKPEMTLFRLREFFAQETNSVIIVVPGVEAGWAGVPLAFGYGISTDIINKLMTKAELDGISFSVEVMAGYSTGYRGLNLTVINRLVDLSKLKRLIYLDAWFHHDDHPKMASGPYVKKNTLFAIDTAFTDSPTVQLVIYAFTHPGGVPRTNASQTNQNIPDPPNEPIAPLITKYPGRVNFIDFEFKFGSRPAIDDALSKICLARLIQLNIGAAVPESTLTPALKALIDALPGRGSLGTLGLAGYTDLYGWVTAHTTEISNFQIAAAMKIITDKQLLETWTNPSHYEMRHRVFVIELGKEPLVP